MERARVARPDDMAIRKEIGNAHAWLADSYYLAGDKSSYLQARRNELSAKKFWLKSDPENNAAKYAVAKAKYAIAAVDDSPASKVSRETLLFDAQETMDKLRKLDASNRDWNAMGKKIEKELEKPGVRRD